MPKIPIAMEENKMVIALMEEYKRSTIDYKLILHKVTTDMFVNIFDEKTTDLDCISIQTITKHVVQSGYTYANYINEKLGGKWVEYNEAIANPNQGIKEINKMLDFTESVLTGLQKKSNKEIAEWVYKTRWGITYNFQQLMAHAIVHVLRHRRQIENI